MDDRAWLLASVLVRTPGRIHDAVISLFAWYLLCTGISRKFRVTWSVQWGTLPRFSRWSFEAGMTLHHGRLSALRGAYVWPRFFEWSGNAKWVYIYVDVTLFIDAVKCSKDEIPRKGSYKIVIAVARAILYSYPTCVLENLSLKWSPTVLTFPTCPGLSNGVIRVVMVPSKKKGMLYRSVLLWFMTRWVALKYWPLVQAERKSPMLTTKVSSTAGTGIHVFVRGWRTSRPSWPGCCISKVIAPKSVCAPATPEISIELVGRFDTGESEFTSEPQLSIYWLWWVMQHFYTGNGILHVFIKHMITVRQPLRKDLHDFNRQFK